jgi:hypothetical protein
MRNYFFVVCFGDSRKIRGKIVVQSQAYWKDDKAK